VRFAVVGAGAIGAYVGASLARGGADVTLIARGPHLEAMRERGVRVLSPRGDFTVAVGAARADITAAVGAAPDEVRAVGAAASGGTGALEATDDLEAVSDAEAVFIALKAYSLSELAPRLGPLLADGAATIWAQNGIPWWYFQSHPGPMEGTRLQSVDPAGMVARSIPAESVIGCVIYSSTEIIEPGVIRHVEGTRFSIGEPHGALTPRCERISACFTAGGLKAPIDTRIRDQIWLKLVGNVAWNPVSTLTGATLGELAEFPEVVDVLRAIIGECANVAEHLGVTFPVSLERRLRAGLAVGDHKTSMLQDLEAGKPLELDCMTGAVIELASAFGIDVPHIRTVHACTKVLAAGGRGRVH
jgi:2-dehydropantoate 2-reductase